MLLLSLRASAKIYKLNHPKGLGMINNKNTKPFLHALVLMLAVITSPLYAYDVWNSPKHVIHIEYHGAPGGTFEDSRAKATADCVDFWATIPWVFEHGACHLAGSAEYGTYIESGWGQEWSGQYDSYGNPVVDRSHLLIYQIDNPCTSGAPDTDNQRCIEPKAPPCPLPCATEPNAPLPPRVDFKNPINITTGNKYQVETDYTDATSSGLTFRRTYNSLSAYSDSASAYSNDNYIGIYWRHNYSQQLTISGDTGSQQVTVSRPNGRKLTFTEQGASFISDADITSKLNQTFTASAHDGWEYHPSATTTEIYNLAGQLIAILKTNGRNLTFNYDVDAIPETLDHIEDFLGRSIQLHYNVNRQIDYIITSNSQQINYTYDARRLKTVTNTTTGDAREYHYEDTKYPKYLTGITDERGIRYSTWSYDAEGRAITSEHANGVESGTVTYNADGSVTTTDSRNTQTTSHFTQILGVNQITQIDRPATATTTAASQYYTYDLTNGQLLTKTGWDGTLTEFGGYDSNNNLGYEIIAKGTPEQRRADYKYEDTINYNKVTRTIEPSVFASNPTLQCTEGTDCKITTYTYDAFGNRTSATINGFTPTGTPVSRTTGYLYNAPLNQLSQIDGSRSDVSDITTLNYHPNDAAEGNNRARLKEIIDANSITVRSNIQYTATGKVDAEERPNGLTLDYSYTLGRDRLETLTETAAGQSRITHWSYLPTGEVKTITQAYGTADATSITFGYDDARRLTRITDGLGNYIQYTLDTEGNKEAENIHDSSGALKKSLTRTFDAYNRMDLVTQANQSSDSDYAVDGTLDKITDGNNSITDYSYDNLKRLTQATQDLGGINALTQYGYDAQDNLTTVTDPNNGITGYLYDDLGNLLVQGSPDTGDTSFTYDEAGNLKTKTDAMGQAFSYSYDALNRLTLLDAPGLEDDSSYRYDSCTNGTGRLCGITLGENGTTPTTATYSYSGFGEVASHQGIGYSYGSAGRLENQTYPSGAIATYYYDAAGQISRVDLNQAGQITTLASNINYKPFGPIASLTYGNGQILTQAFDNAYRITSQDIAGLTSTSYPLYDGNGNLKQQVKDADTHDYSYDSLNRLDIAQGSFGSQDFDYDDNGNRLSLTQDSVPQSYSYEPNSNRLDLIDALDIQLDLNGNTTNQGLRSYSFNSHNRLSAAHDNGMLLATYGYNGLGQRISKSQPGAALAGDTNGDNTITAEDISAVVNQILELSTASGNPDCTGDGLVNVIDIVC